MGAVHLAILGGHRDCAAALLQRGAGLGGHEETPLQLAVRGGDAATIAWCLQRGEPFTGGLCHLAGSGRADAVRVLLAAGADAGAPDTEGGVTPLQLAADRGHDACVAALLEAGAPVGPAIAGRGLTALHLAAMHGHDDCVRLLLDASAPRDAQDADGRTARDWAAGGNHTMTAALLEIS